MRAIRFDRTASRGVFSVHTQCRKAALATALALALCGWDLSAATLYVDGSATGANNGSSWADAYTDLEAALAAALAGDEIWVAAGTYTSAAGRDSTFQLTASVGVYGGFTSGGAGEPNKALRPATGNETILSGDIGTIGDAGDNCYHVVTAASNATIERFTIRDGRADIAWDYWRSCGAGLQCSGQDNFTVENCLFTANWTYWHGAGLYCDSSSMTLTNSRFENNIQSNWGGYYGGGAFITGGKSGVYPSIAQCIFQNNAAWGGGGLYLSDATVPVSKCVFSGNTALGQHGGGVHNGGATATYSNCVFSANSSTSGVGGGMYTIGAAKIVNGSFVGNSAGGNGGAIYGDSTPIVKNCILWDNSAPNGN